MAYTVEVSPAPARDFRKLEREIQLRLRPHIDALAADPRRPSAKKLKAGSELWRIRVGDYHVVYEIRDRVLNLATKFVNRVSGHSTQDNPSGATQRPYACVYCGETGPVTRDHVPPRSIFPDPKPADLITIPACHDCNAAFKRDDEYFRTFVVTGSYQSPGARRLWDRKIIGSPNAESIRQILRRSMMDCEIRSPSGLYLGKASAVLLNERRVLRVAARISLGLWWHHYRIRPESSIKIYGGLLLKLEGEVEQILNACQKSSIGGDAFAYAHRVPPEDRHRSVWFMFMQFYGGLTFFVLATRNQQFESDWMFEVPRASLMGIKGDG